jgi:hypothetical protein
MRDGDPQSSMAIAKEWLDTCWKGHARCNGLSAQNPDIQLPARLLEIGAPTVDQVRLWFPPKGTNLAPCVSYMTLSHCWGSAQFLTLTKRTLPKLKAGISTSKLPKTFQDAVYITRKMGIRFLWIDSLCILQDSISDWQHEAALMADVYRGSLCNIAATGASDANGGCLYPQRIPPKPCLVKTLWDNTPNNKYLVYDENFWYGVFESDALRQRGWVVQELLLSPRILHMGIQMYWECYESRACEVYPDGIPGFFETASKKIPVEETRLWRQGTYSVQDWAGLIHTYTSCNLIKPQDKLVAISGVVKIIQRSTGDQYFAGIWRNNLPQQLLWRDAYDQSTPLIPAKKYRAPSWSWASVDGRITIPIITTGDILVNVLDVFVQSVSNDSTGIVTGGRIKLSGHMTTIQLDIKLKFVREKFSYTFLGRDGLKARHASRSSNAPPENLHYLAVKYHAEYLEYECLLLIPTKAQRGEFYRWGFISVDRDDFDKAKAHDWLEYEECDAKGNYTVSII